MNKKVLEKIRIPQKTEEKIKEIKRITEPYLAAKNYIDLIENYYMTERATPSLYNQENGKPEKWDWKPYEKIEQISKKSFLFDGIIVFVKNEGDIGRHGQNENIINKKVKEFFYKNVTPKNPILLEVNNKKYIAHLESVGIQRYQDGPIETKSGITFRRLRNKLGLEGLTKE